MSMRNLSKVLALVLSLAFVLTMFAGAIDPTIPDYLDKNELTGSGSEAVAVLSALGAVEGFPDGEFKPDEDVTRAQFAKMLSIADAGADVKAQYATNAIGSFTDSIDEWALPYLNYAYLNEIMVGYGDNTIRPQSNVTGFEAAKMTLVALGYDPKVEGLEGPQWQNNTAKLANRIGLLKNLESENMYGEFDREATAILVRNAIYTETVSYVGSYANGTGMTLGEEVFDLIDVRGIVVANDYGAIGLNWEDVLTDATSWNRAAYVQYTQPAKGETRFAYRDYTGAATEGGYYLPRVITTKIASDNADLGRAYRVLATGAKNPTNTSEVRKVYGILGEIASDANYKFTAKPVGKAAIDAMLAAAALITPGVTEESVQGNVYIDGKPASYKAAKELVAAQGASSAPGYYVDNDNDGIVDFVYLYNYKAAKVQSFADGKAVLWGVGTYPAEGVAEGDFVAYWGDKQFKYTKKLDSYTGKVTGYTINSLNWDGTSGASAVTTRLDGKYTINGSAKTFGWLSETFTADERVYFQQLLGKGSSAVEDATLQFIFDGDYIVAVFKVAETHWDNYAIVIGTNNDRYLGMQHIRLLTEDNEYKDFYVASYNGQQIYNTIVAWNPLNFQLVNNLVRYEEIGNNMIYLYTADYANASSYYRNDDYLYFDQTTGMWESHDYGATGIQNGTMYDWKNGVVFVTYGAPLYTVSDAWNQGAYQWRAYWYGEFMPADEWEATPLDDKITFWNVPAGEAIDGDEVVYADRLNGVRTLKAAAITFDYYGVYSYVLPGLPLRAGQAIWGTIMDATNIASVSDGGVAKYAFQVKILKPWSTDTETITVYADGKLQTFVKGDIYKLYVDEDGICRRWELALANGTAFAGERLGTDYLELGKFMLINVIENGDGSYYFLVKRGLTDGTFSAETEKLYVPKGTDLYFVKNLLATGISAVDSNSVFGTLGSLSFANHKAYVCYFDMNPTEDKVLSGWIDTAAKINYTLKDVPITVTYNTNTKKATYTINPGYGVYFEGAKTSITVDCEPYELKAPVGDNVLVNLALTYVDNGGWYVADVDSIKGYSWAKFDLTNSSGVDYSTSGLLKVITPGWSMNDTPKTFNLNVTSAQKWVKNTSIKPLEGSFQGKTYYDLATDSKVASIQSTDTQGFWTREGIFADVYPIYGLQSPFPVTDPTAVYFYRAAAAGQSPFDVTDPEPFTVQYGYNPDLASQTDVDAYTYESFYVMYADDSVGKYVDASGVIENIADAAVIVYIDQNGTVNVGGGGSIVYPYVP